MELLRDLAMSVCHARRHLGTVAESRSVCRRQKALQCSMRRLVDVQDQQIVGRHAKPWPFRRVEYLEEHLRGTTLSPFISGDLPNKPE